MTPTRVMVRFGAGVAAGVLAVAVIAGYASRRSDAAVRTGGVLAAGHAGGAWASRAELGWLRKVGAWNLALLGRLRTGNVDASCAARLGRTVGRPPTARLQRAFLALERACTEAQSDVLAGAHALVRVDRTLPPGELRSLPVIAGVSSESRIEPRFGRIASRLAGKRVEVRCWSRPDWDRLVAEEKAYTRDQIDEHTLGFAGIAGSRVNLAPAVCESLVALVYGGVRPASPDARFRLALGLVTLAHEPQHAKGIASEARAECYAIQLLAPTAASLGVDRSYARTLTQAYWSQYGGELPAYRSSECRDGGALDLRKSTSAWP